MSELKTEVITLDKSKNVKLHYPSHTSNFTQSQLKTIQIGHIQQPVKTIRQHLEEIKEQARDTRHITNINPYASYFPDFYRRELKNAFYGFIVWICITLLSFVGIGLAINGILRDEECSPYVCLLLIPIFVLVCSLFIVSLTKWFNFRGEAKTINFKDEKTLSINVVKVYKRLKTGHINVNWMSLTSYIVFGLVILINFIVAFAMTGYKFGTWDVNQVSNDWKGVYIVFEIVFWCSVCAIILTLLLHASLLLTNYIRYSRIENFYNFQIVPQEELDIIKKQKNRRDLIIFLCAIAFIGLIGYFVYKLVKRSKTTKVVVH